MFWVNGMMKKTSFVIHRSSTDMTSGDVPNIAVWGAEDKSRTEWHNQE